MNPFQFHILLETAAKRQVEADAIQTFSCVEPICRHNRPPGLEEL